MPTAFDTRDESLTQALHDAGLRVTASRLGVLRVLRENQGHFPADEIAKLARRRLGSLSLQSTYDNLHTLVKAGLARSIEVGEKASLYEARVGDNHHHLVCRSCGVIEDVDCQDLARPCLRPYDDHGFLVQEAEVTYWGLCPSCRAQAVKS